MCDVGVETLYILECRKWGYDKEKKLTTRLVKLGSGMTKFIVSLEGKMERIRVGDTKELDHEDE